MKVALIHDHLAQDGGAERTLRVLTELFPDAPIYTLLYDKKNVEKNFKGKHIEASIIQKLPWGVTHYRWYLLFMPIAVEFFDLSSYDLVISDASAFAKGVITNTETLHICYCHTPTRYLWSDTHQYINELKYNKYFKKVISLTLSYLRIWDRAAAGRVDRYIANSKFISRRIKKYYDRESTVIYPPIDVENFKPAEQVGDFYLSGGRLVPYKRFDIVIEAFKKLPHKKLKIFGSGLDLERLKKIAGDAPNIEFLGRVSDEERTELYAKCLAFINPQEEDFGITPIEAMASGRPVIAYGKGGVKETIVSKKTGEFFYEQTGDSIYEVLKDFDPNSYDAEFIRAHSEQFSKERFKQEIKRYIENEYKCFAEDKCDL
ncbi:MAG: Glycosyl transferase group 1 [Parcubacteria group bacterium GW2011_GWE2_39_37]|uniref:GDP-Man:Man(1)GlcNAc(2)-PP-Dol alpha-1,3-mannosyltransferase n=1 Tax=Candidatus Falkowbacteria bacterium GW2011_GWF2_39_8 TaxID=1618642 RepID=A0A0G0T2W9_9BACT|nr:MAG: Glycosyl transferase group 1 [Parcubacteria group bacterium GW2011_GWE2_39_37]KKR32142.1 MAG: Glycosyl transferase group 1 [Candidatus Falkowbacteria bacterium GW2011_GWF2_39_8]